RPSRDRRPHARPALRDARADRRALHPARARSREPAEPPAPDGLGTGRVPAVLLRAGPVRNRAMTRMRRRVTVGIVIAACAAAAWGVGASARQQPPPVRPNILWISTEDMSPHLGAYGDRLARTPTLDRLAAESLRFTNAFATAPVCAPSRAAIITGMY